MKYGIQTTAFLFSDLELVEFAWLFEAFVTIVKTAVSQLPKNSLGEEPELLCFV